MWQTVIVCVANRINWKACFFGTMVAAIIIGITAAAKAADLNAAKNNYVDLCARCHGPDGLGNGPEGETLSTRPRNFRDCALMDKDSDDFVFNEIKGGSASVGRSNDMPAWGEGLDDADIRNLLAYVRAFCHPTGASK